MPVQYPFTAFLNHYFAGVANAVLHAVHVPVKYPSTPIDNSFAMEVLVFAVLLIFFILVRTTLSVEKPGPIQMTAEAIHEFVDGQAESIIGHGYERYVAFCTCVGIFILLCNLLGLVPTFMSPTSKPWVSLGVATLTFLYYNYQGIREQGILRYAKHFGGPIWQIAWFMVLIEVISHLARVLSLTVRLYANMFAGDMVTLVAFSLIPIGLPVAGNALHLAVSVIQAYVFMLLTMIYVAQATAHEEV
jgi:F-type H+-transporting ATPase subunit a